MSGLCYAPAGYTAGGVLGRGALTETFEVERDGVTYVCKRLVPRAAFDAAARASMEDEARALEALAGRGAPRFVANGEDERGLFVVMERVAGETLATAAMRGLQAGAEAHAAWIDVVARRAFATLALVHRAGDAEGELHVLHADISPPNVMVDDGGREVFLIDFALARFRGAHRPRTGAFRGTLAFSSPELARGEPIDGRADIFALGATLLYAASGVSPRHDTDAVALLMRAAEEPLDAYAQAAARALPRDVANALARCVAFAPDDRPSRAEDVFGGETW